VQSVEYRGLWWRPADSEKRVAGVLTFRSGQRPTLELLGSFFDAAETLNRMFGSYVEPVILGESSTGQQITLLDCTETPADGTLNFVSANYEATFLLVGRHFERDADALFRVIEVSFTNLEDWTLIHGFANRPEAATAGGVSLTYEPPLDRAAYAGGLDMTLTHRFSVEQPGVGERRIVQSTLLRIVAPEPRPLRELLNGPVVTLRSLVALGTSVPVHPALLEAYCTAPANPKEVIQVLCNTGSVEEPRRLAHTDMLFVFGDIADRFAEVLQRWFDDQEVIGPTVDLYVGTLYGQRMYLHHEFLSLAQALESLHQRVGGSGALMSDSAFESLRRELSAAIPRYFPSRDCEDTRREVRVHERLHPG